MSTATKTLAFESIIEKEAHGNSTVYVVVGSKGDLYRVTTVGSEATGCTCEARVKCYHMRGVESFIQFEIAWNAPIVNEMDTVDETPAPVVTPMSVAEFVLGKFGEDLEAHIQDEFCDDFAGQAQAIIDKERIREEAEAHLDEQQRYSLAKYREVTANMQRLQQMATKREQAPLGKQNDVVEMGPCGPVLMAS